MYQMSKYIYNVFEVINNANVNNNQDQYTQNAGTHKVGTVLRQCAIDAALIFLG